MYFNKENWKYELAILKAIIKLLWIIIGAICALILLFYCGLWTLYYLSHVNYDAIADYLTQFLPVLILTTGVEWLLWIFRKQKTKVSS